MVQKGLSEIAEDLAAGYPTEDLRGIQQDFLGVLEIVLPLIAEKAEEAGRGGNEGVEEIWKALRGHAESDFQKALVQLDRLKVLYVTSKFMNNRKVGTAITELALELANTKED